MNQGDSVATATRLEWTIDSIDRAVVASAEKAAQAAGLTLEEWLSRAIVEAYRQQSSGRTRKSPLADAVTISPGPLFERARPDLRASSDLGPAAADLLVGIDREEEATYAAAPAERLDTLLEEMGRDGKEQATFEPEETPGYLRLGRLAVVALLILLVGMLAWAMIEPQQGLFERPLIVQPIAPPGEAKPSERKASRGPDEASAPTGATQALSPLAVEPAQKTIAPPPGAEAVTQTVRGASGSTEEESPREQRPEAEATPAHERATETLTTAGTADGGEQTANQADEAVAETPSQEPRAGGPSSAAPSVAAVAEIPPKEETVAEDSSQPTGSKPSQDAEKAKGDSSPAMVDRPVADADAVIVQTAEEAREIKQPLAGASVDQETIAGGEKSAAQLAEQAPPPTDDQVAGAPAVPATPPQTAALAPDLPDSVARFTAAAQAGDPDAQHDLALIYIQGRGVAQDYETAAYWFREAAMQGNANAQYNLGVMYERGLGVPRDSVEALLLYLAAAEQGHIAAQYNAGLAYAEGGNIPRNFTEARRWFSAAAEQGLPEAQYNLGIIYENGLGIARDELTAYRYYGLAAAAGHHEAERKRDLIAARLSPSERDTAERLVRDSLAGSRGATHQTAVPRPVRIREIQDLLASLGYDPGPADGVIGGRTLEAIEQYQQAQGLVVDGKASDELLNHLRRQANR